MTPKPEQNEALLGSLLSAMSNVNNATMHLIAIEPYLGTLPEISRLEDIFAKLRSLHQTKVQETQA